MGKLKVEGLRLGQLPTNCYFVMDEESKELLLVDPADEADRILRKIREMGGVLSSVLLTHGHYDHIGALRDLRRAARFDVCAMEEERSVLASPDINLSRMFGHPVAETADRWLHDGQILKLLGREITVRHTPGHTDGGACYYFPEDGIVFSGDTLFHGSVGRTDFPTGSMSQLVTSIREKLLSLPGDTTVLPGHEEATTVEAEKNGNPYL